MKRLSISLVVAAFLATLLQTASVTASPPTVTEVVSAARQHAGVDGPLDRWSARARWRALAPRVGAWVGGDRTEELDFSFREYVGRDAQGELFLDSTQNTSEDDESRRFAWRVSLTFDLRDAIFSPAELAAAREERARRAERIRLDFDVMSIFRTWRSAETSEDRSFAAAQLDVLTGGWFSRRLSAGGAR